MSDDIVKRLEARIACPLPPTAGYAIQLGGLVSDLQDAKAEIERLRSPMPKSQMRRLAHQAPEKVMDENERLRKENERLEASYEDALKALKIVQSQGRVVLKDLSLIERLEQEIERLQAERNEACEKLLELDLRASSERDLLAVELRAAREVVRQSRFYLAEVNREPIDPGDWNEAEEDLESAIAVYEKTKEKG